MLSTIDGRTVTIKEVSVAGNFAVVHVVRVIRLYSLRSKRRSSYSWTCVFV